MSRPELLDLSKEFVGVEYVQGPGGNTSVKDNSGSMWIKASGQCLSDLFSDPDSAVEVQVQPIEQRVREYFRLRDVDLTEVVSQATSKNSGKRASMETAMHAVLDRYVVHLHPIYVNVLVCMESGKDLISEIYADLDWNWVPYRTPGLELAVEIFQTREHSNRPIFFLQNHGVLVHGNELSDVKELTAEVCRRAQEYLVQKNVSRFSVVSDLTGVSSVDYFPDTVVFRKFLGGIDQIDSTEKRRAIEEIFSAHQYIERTGSYCGERMRTLSQKALNDLLGLNEEKYRQKQYADTSESLK